MMALPGGPGWGRYTAPRHRFVRVLFGLNNLDALSESTEHRVGFSCCNGMFVLEGHLRRLCMYVFCKVTYLTMWCPS